MILTFAVWILVGIIWGIALANLLSPRRQEARLARSQRARTLRWERTHPDPARLDATYALADDLDVPLIEVVLDAEARADPDYWKPKPPPPDPYESAHELLNRPTTIIGHGVQFRRGGIIHGPRATRLGPAREPGPW